MVGLIGTKQEEDLTTNVLTNGAINPSLLLLLPQMLILLLSSVLLFHHVQIITGHTGKPPERKKIEFERSLVEGKFV